MTPNLGVITIVLHFFITMAVLGGYLWTLLVMKQPDETLKSLLFLIGGYWFGVLGDKTLKSKAARKEADKP